MKMNRKSMVVLALVAIVGVGLVSAYTTNACDGEKTATQASAKQASGKGADCCAMKDAAQASGKKVECDKAAMQASGKADGCCAAKSAMQASAKSTDATMMTVGSGASCGTAQKASGSSCQMGAKSAFADNCDGCKLYKKYWTALEASKRDVATLPDGIVVHLTSNDAAVVSELQKYSHEKASLMATISDKSFKGTLCGYCGEKAQSMKGASFRVADASNGVYTVITAAAPETVEQLHKIAAAELAAAQTTVGG